MRRRIDHVIDLGLVALLPLGAAALIATACYVVGEALAMGVIATGLVGVAAVVVELRQNQQRHVRRGRRWALLVLLGSSLSLGGVVWYAEPRPLTSLHGPELVTALLADARLYHEHRRGMEAAVARLGALGLPPPDGSTLSADDERALLDSWRSMLRYAVALEALRVFYEDYYRIDLGAHRDEHVASFMLSFAAEAALYENGARFAARILSNDNAKKFLDTPHEGLEASSFSYFREQFLGVGDGMRVRAGQQYLTVTGAIPQASELWPIAADLAVALKRHLASIDKLGVLPSIEMTSRAELQSLKRTLQRSWYPIQKAAAEALGDTRVRRIGNYLIDHALREHVDAALQPGDIVLSRKNWYLSNVGLPGFWPHAILYLGTPDKLARYFDDPAVARWLDTGFGTTRFDEAMERRHPAAWQSYLSQSAPHGGEPPEPRRVLEAISEGVSFSTLASSAGDYLAALRPRLDKLAKAKAVAHAFAQFRKPYDFDFDFATEHALVCTELVWRAYRPSHGKAGLDLTLASMAGRSTLPANDIACQYGREYGSDEAQFDFVVFVDAREKERQAFLSTEAAFRASCDRSQWDVSLE